MASRLLWMHLMDTINMKKLIIVGASGFGREVIQWVEDINAVKPEWEILGFIDDNPNALDGWRCDYRIIGSIDEWQPKDDEFFACAIALPNVKCAVVTSLLERGAKFATLIHPTALVNKYTQIGEGVIITPRSSATADTKIGNFVTILGSGIGHDASIGDYSTLSGRCSINGHVEVGKMVYIACGVSVAPSRKIGDGAFVGIGSVVVTNVKAGTKVFGNPAKKVVF